MASKELLKGLNNALNRELTTAIRYLIQGASLKGVQWDTLRTFYLNEVDDELEHAKYLANKIVMLGGTPELNIDLSPPPSNPQAMLENDINLERDDVINYLELASLAEREGIVELKVKMEEAAAEEAHHAETMLRFHA